MYHWRLENGECPFIKDDKGRPIGLKGEFYNHGVKISQTELNEKLFGTQKFQMLFDRLMTSQEDRVRESEKALKELERLRNLN